MVFWRGGKLASGQGTDLKRSSQPGAQGCRAGREGCWSVSAARLETGGGCTKQEVGKTSPEVPQGRGIFYKGQRRQKSGTEEGARSEGLGGVQECREAITHE